ncbi:hypothetical protein CVS40_4168 [Lucilia cuprina]|nr:hypothetical protein CVS40_4168 [Lucilia cuprina]
MAAIPKILERQKVIGDEIVCIHTKLDDRPIRLPKLNDFKKRVLKFKDEFRANNETLSKYGNKSEDYFSQGYFDYITTIIKEIDEIIINEESRTEKATEISSINKDTKIMEVPYVTEYAQKHTINEEFSKMANSLKELCDELITNIETLSITSLPIKQKQLESRYQRMLNKFEKVPEAMNIDELLTETEDYYYKALIIINNKKGDAESTPKSASNIDFSSSANLSKIKIPEFGREYKRLGIILRPYFKSFSA